MSRRAVSVVWAFMIALVVGITAANAKEVTVTGKVGDAMCGLKHKMASDEAGCTRACIKNGSDYALIVKDKALMLKADTDQTKAALNKLAGKRARIIGDQNGDTIQVTSVGAAK
jgi:hypothetical protein